MSVNLNHREPSRRRQKNTPTASLQRGKTSLSSKSVLDMTQNNLIVKLQYWSFGKCGVLLHCHYPQVHSSPGWLYLIGSNRIAWHYNCLQTNVLCSIELLEIELFDHLAVGNDWRLIELFVIHSNTWNNLTLCKNRKLGSGSFKNVINKKCQQIIYI